MTPIGRPGGAETCIPPLDSHVRLRRTLNGPSSRAHVWSLDIVIWEIVWSLYLGNWDFALGAREGYVADKGSRSSEPPGRGPVPFFSLSLTLAPAVSGPRGVRTCPRLELGETGGFSQKGPDAWSATRRRILLEAPSQVASSQPPRPRTPLQPSHSRPGYAFA